MVLRKVRGSEREEVTGHRRKLRNEELHDVYYPPINILAIKSRRPNWVEHMACTGANRYTYTVFLEGGGVNHEERAPLGRPGHRWGGNITIRLREIESKGVERINLALVTDE
jgi:hypothetical protein